MVHVLCKEANKRNEGGKEEADEGGLLYTWGHGEGGEDQANVGDLFATGGLGDIQAQAAANDHARVCGLTTAKVCEDIHSPCYH